jgi:uncharacterized protein YbgA (DUF1722 family)/uncharacterized protein YbbK (DUF523 family)
MHRAVFADRTRHSPSSGPGLMPAAHTAGRASSGPPPLEAPIRLGVSACLLGQEVRYDAGHKRESFVADMLPRYFDVVPVCPEVAIGMGVPREPIRLEGTADAPRAVGVRTKTLDVTDRLRAYAREMAEQLGGISGYVLKSKSPSCGMRRVTLYDANGHATKTGTGIYAAEIMRAMPLLPVEEEGRLNDPVLRENFIGRVYAYHRWQELLREGVTLERLVDFHAAHKLILMAHDRERLTKLGRVVADAGEHPLDELVPEYGETFMAALSRRATRRRHTDVLYHLMGYLKRVLADDDKAELVEVVEAYRAGLVPLIVPVTLLRHHFRRNPHPYIDQQLYLSWPSAGLSLWNAT